MKKENRRKAHIDRGTIRASNRGVNVIFRWTRHGAKLRNIGYHIGESSADLYRQPMAACHVRLESRSSVQPSNR